MCGGRVIRALKKAAPALLLACLAQVFAAQDRQGTVGGYSEKEAMRLGERIYRDGILPSGKPIIAMVLKDIPMVGTFACAGCHLRSGVGSLEGPVITLPANGADLYKPRYRGSELVQKQKEKAWFEQQVLRPAYTDATLARALRESVDPGGREFDYIMPRFKLDDRDMEVLIFYLKNLSAKYSPGVDETTIRFATVITDDVRSRDREAMLGVLEAYISGHNAQTRNQEKRAKHGPWYKLEKYTAYRRLELVLWDGIDEDEEGFLSRSSSRVP